MIKIKDTQQSWINISSKLKGMIKENSMNEDSGDYIDITHEMNVYLSEDIKESRLYTTNGFSSVSVYTDNYNLYCSDLPEDLCKLIQSYLEKPIKGYVTQIHKLCDSVGVSYRKLRLFSQLVRGALRVADEIVIDRELPICNSIYMGSIENPLYKINIVKDNIEIDNVNYNILITEDKKIIRYENGMYFNVYNPQVMESLTIDDIRIVNAIVHLLNLDISWFNISEIDYTITKSDLEKIKRKLKYANPNNLVSSRFTQCFNNVLNEYISELSLGFIPSLVLLRDTYEKTINNYKDISESHLWEELDYRNL